MSKPVTLSAASFLFASFFVIAPVNADERAPVAQEWAGVVEALAQEGYVRWKEIEFDDGMWEVDDAFTANGEKYDLKLNRSFEVVERERD